MPTATCLACAAQRVPIVLTAARAYRPAAFLPLQLADSSARPSTALARPPTATPSRPPTATATPAPAGWAAGSRPGSASPLALDSRPSTAGSSGAGSSSAAARYTDARSVVAGVADRLSAATVDQVKDALRGALLDERAALLEDVEYLQGLLEAEADLQVGGGVGGRRAVTNAVHDVQGTSRAPLQRHAGRARALLAGIPMSAASCMRL